MSQRTHIVELMSLNCIPALQRVQTRGETSLPILWFPFFFMISSKQPIVELNHPLNDISYESWHNVILSTEIWLVNKSEDFYVCIAGMILHLFQEGGAFRTMVELDRQEMGEWLLSRTLIHSSKRNFADILHGSGWGWRDRKIWKRVIAGRKQSDKEKCNYTSMLRWKWFSLSHGGYSHCTQQKTLICHNKKTMTDEVKGTDHGYNTMLY